MKPVIVMAFLLASVALAWPQQTQEMEVTWRHPDPPETIDYFVILAVRAGAIPEKLGETPRGDGTARSIVVPLPAGSFGVSVVAYNKQGRASKPSEPVMVLGEPSVPDGVSVTVNVEVKVRVP